MKENTKITWKLLFGSLIKNDAATEGAKTRPWWIALILFIIGTFLPIIPIMTNASKTYGSSFLSGDVYNYDQGLVTASLDLKAQGYSFEVTDNFELLEKKDDVLQEQTWVDDVDTKPIAVYESTDSNGITHRVLNVFYTDRPFSTSTYSVKNLIKTIEATKYVKNTTVIYQQDVHTEINAKSDLYLPSYLLLYKTGSYARIYKSYTTTSAQVSYSGLNWKNIDFKSGSKELIKEVLTVEGYDYDALTHDTAKSLNYVNGSMSNWKRVFDGSYKTQKWNNFWFSSGLYWGIYLVLVMFLGLLMWLLTRGKNNPNRNLTLWIGMKIAAWIVFTPGLLAMILGFIWSAAAGLGFIVLIGIRAMWLSMRQLSPVADQSR